MANNFKPASGCLDRVQPGFLVFLGGAGGSGIRALLDYLIGWLGWSGMASSTIFVNVAGAFLMGWLIAYWQCRRENHPVWDRLKLLLGSGFLGAFTTYSTFALAIAKQAEFGLAELSSSLLSGFTVICAGFVGVVLGVALAGYLGDKKPAGKKAE